WISMGMGGLVDGSDVSLTTAAGRDFLVGWMSPFTSTVAPFGGAPSGGSPPGGSVKRDPPTGPRLAALAGIHPQPALQQLEALHQDEGDDQVDQAGGEEHFLVQVGARG